jgi:hypothetical protein
MLNENLIVTGPLSPPFTADYYCVNADDYNI